MNPNTTKYPKYKPTNIQWLGDIPEHWDTLPIRAIFDERNEKNDGSQTDFILSVTKNRGVIPYDEKGQIGNNKSEDIERYKLVYPNDFVINKMNVIIGSLGISKYFGAFSQVYLVYKPKSEDINIKYYSYVFSNPAFYKSLRKYCTGIMELRESLNKNDFKKLQLPFPSIQTQKKIATFLDEKTEKINQAITQKQQLIALLKERQQIIIQNAVTGKILGNNNEKIKMKNSGIPWIGDIPQHWEVKKIGHFSKIGNGSTPSRDNSKYWTDKGFPWLNSSKVNEEIILKSNQFVTEKAIKECHLPIIEKGTILMAITGEGKTRGMVAICGIKSTINQHIAYVNIQNNAIKNTYLIKVFEAMYKYIRANSSGQGSTKGAITCDSIKKLKIPIPPLEEQTKIVSFIENQTQKIGTAIANQTKQIAKLKEYKATLIDSAVTGKVMINE